MQYRGLRNSWELEACNPISRIQLGRQRALVGGAARDRVVLTADVWTNDPAE
jgi:hypothetical protein